MKKLVIAAFALTCGLAANAAVVDWQYKITKASSSGLYDNYVVYLVDASAWDAAVISGITAATFENASIVKDSTIFNSGTGMNGNKTYSTVQEDLTAGLRAKALPDSYISSDAKSDINTKNFYYIVLNTNADPNTWQNVASVTLTGRIDTGEAQEEGITSATQAVFDGGTWTPVGAGPTPVPEPTTGLLVLAGLAGLALRRRRA